MLAYAEMSGNFSNFAVNKSINLINQNKQFNMERTFLVFSCHLEGRQLREGEHGLLADKEVVQAICDADFRDHSLDLVNPESNMRYHHEYVKQPKCKLYLMRVVNPNNRSSRCLNEIYAASIFSAMAYADSLPSCVSQNVMIENNFQGNIKQLQING